MKEFLRKVEHMLTAFNNGLELLTGLIIFVFMAMLCFQVFLRYIFKSPIYGIDEFVVAMMIWSCSLSWATVYWQNGHAILEFIVKNLPETIRRIIFNAINVLVLIINVIIVPASWKLFKMQLKQAPVGGLPFCKAYYYALPVLAMGIILVVYNVYKLIAYPILKDDLIVAPIPSEEGNAID